LEVLIDAEVVEFVGHVVHIHRPAGERGPEKKVTRLKKEDKLTRLKKEKKFACFLLPEKHLFMSTYIQVA
jgi:hypothetical protein